MFSSASRMAGPWSEAGLAHGLEDQLSPFVGRFHELEGIVALVAVLGAHDGVDLARFGAVLGRGAKHPGKPVGEAVGQRLYGVQEERILPDEARLEAHGVRAAHEVGHFPAQAQHGHGVQGSFAVRGSCRSCPSRPCRTPPRQRASGPRSAMSSVISCLANCP